MQRGFMPFVGHAANGTITSEPSTGLPNAAAPAELPEPNIFGTPVSELSKPELWKLEQNGLDTWDRLLAHAENDQLPDEQNTFYLRYHGMFYVGPAQESIMLRMRIPAGELTSAQMDGLRHGPRLGWWVPGCDHARQFADPPDCTTRYGQGGAAFAGTRADEQGLRRGQRTQYHRHAHGRDRP